MNIRLLVIVSLFVCASTANAQSTTEKQKVIIDQIITYLKRLRVVAAEWVKNPEKKEYRKEMEDLVKAYDNVKEHATAVFILMSSDVDRSALTELLNKHNADKNELINQLLLWKYSPQPILGLDMIHQLDEIHEASKSVLLNLQDEKSADDALSVLLSEDAVESRIIPLSKTLIDNLVKLQSGK